MSPLSIIPIIRYQIMKNPFEPETRGTVALKIPVRIIMAVTIVQK
jgi:hypothetical protein